MKNQPSKVEAIQYAVALLAFDVNNEIEDIIRDDVNYIVRDDVDDIVRDDVNDIKRDDVNDIVNNEININDIGNNKKRGLGIQCLK